MSEQQKPTKAEYDKAFKLMQQVVAQKRIDAWDLGYERILSPGDIDTALHRMIDSFGIQGAWKLILPMNKRPYQK